MKRTAIYMRVSSAVQAAEGDSIAAQRDALHKYIDAHNDMVCAGEYLDDGISGTKEDRDELVRLLSDVRAGKVDLILVTKLDRLYRSIRHYLNMMDTLDRYGVGWLAIWEPIYDTTTPQGRLIVNQMMSIAQFEAEQTGQRIRQVQAYKVTQGEAISGNTPPGLIIKDKHVVPDRNADKVREMFTYYSRCGNLSETMRHFDHLGIFPRTKYAYKNMMQNTKYIGVFRNNDHFCEPIIDKELFDDVQRKLKMNVKKSQRHVYIFSGLVKCAECGTVMAAGTYTKKRNGKTIRVKRYRCGKRYTHGIVQCDNCKHIYENVLEKYLLDNIRPMLQDFVLRAEIKAAPMREAHTRIAALERRIEKLKELFINDLISLDEYKRDKEQMLSEIADLNAIERRTAVDTTSLKEFLEQPFETLYDTFTDEEKRFFWRSVIKEIRFGLDRKYDIVFL